MADELPPVVTELTAKFDKLTAALVAVEGEMKAFGDRVSKQQKASGEKAGKDAGEALMREYRKAVESGAKLPSFSKVLDQDIAHTRNTISELAKDLKKTGDIDVFNKLRSAEKDLKSFEKLGKEFSDAMVKGAENGLKDTITDFSTAFNKFVQGLPAQAQAALVGLVVAISPVLVSALGGALLAGIGASGIGAAIVGQLQDPQIQTELKSLGDTALGVLQKASAPFQPVIAQALSQLKGLAGQSFEPLQKVFAELAPEGQAFFGGIMDFVKEAAPGFLQALRAGGQILEQLAPTLKQAGDMVAIFFESVANGSQGGGDALALFIRMTFGLLDVIGLAIQGFESLYEHAVGIADLFMGKFGEGFLRLSGHSQTAWGDTLKLGGAFGDAADKAKDYAAAMDKLNNALETHINQALAASNATIAQKQSVEDLSVSIAKNGDNWNINTDAGRNNTTALNRAIEMADRKRQADVKNGADAVQAAQTFNDEANALLTMAGNAGLDKKALDALAGTYIVDIHYDVIDRRKTFLSAQDFAANPSGIAIGGFHGPYGGVTYAASGLMPPTSPGIVLAAEPQTGGEYLIPRRGISQTRAADLIGAAAADHNLSMRGDGAYLSIRIPLSIGGRQVAEAVYEDFVNFSQERKSRRGATGLQ